MAFRFLPYNLVVALLAGLAVVLVLAGVFTGKEAFLWFVPLLSTFFGATFAFRLNEQKERAKEADRQRATLNRALLILGAQWNEVTAMGRQLRAHKNDYEQAFTMPAWASPPMDDRLPIEDLVFLIDGSEPNILFELMIEQQRFDQCMAALRFRGQFYVDHVQPAMLTGGVLGRLVSTEMLREAIGDHIFTGAMQGAKMLRDQIYPSEISLKQAIDHLRKLGSELRPDWKLLTFEELPPEQVPSGARHSATSPPPHH